MRPTPLSDGGRFDVEGVTVRLKVNPRARRVSLRIDARTGEAVATAPSARRLGDALEFARTRHRWLTDRHARRTVLAPLVGGQTIRLFGADYVLRLGARRPRLVAGAICGCGQDVIDPQLVIRAIRSEALRVFRELAATHCARLGVTAPALSVTDPRSRWGSCTPPARGRAASVRLSWRLALAPFEVADYVVAHECAHLIEANHGPRFWALVHSLVGDPSAHRAYLRTEGPRLHGFGR